MNSRRCLWACAGKYRETRMNLVVFSCAKQSISRYRWMTTQHQNEHTLPVPCVPTKLSAMLWRNRTLGATRLGCFGIRKPRYNPGIEQNVTHFSTKKRQPGTRMTRFKVALELKLNFLSDFQSSEPLLQQFGVLGLLQGWNSPEWRKVWTRRKNGNLPSKWRASK